MRAHTHVHVKDGGEDADGFSTHTPRVDTNLTPYMLLQEWAGSAGAGGSPGGCQTEGRNRALQEAKRRRVSHEGPEASSTLLLPAAWTWPGFGGREGGSLDVAAARVWMETPLVTQAIAAPRWPLFQMPGQGDDQSWAPHTPCPKMCQHG